MIVCCTVTYAYLHVQVLNWSRHRNPDLWGPDAGSFDPWRDFRPEELVAVGGPLAAVNPQSGRFSPFAYGPRSCLGRNFAQMEMRLIFAYLLRDLEFSLAGPWARAAATGEEPRGINRGTFHRYRIIIYLLCFL